MDDQRRKFVMEALEQGANLSALCRKYGVTRKTGRQWRDRARQDGLAGLRERSRRPRHTPRKLQEQQVCGLVRLKIAYPHWGPKKLCQIYRESRGTSLSLSTYNRVLKAAGLIKERKVRVRRPVSLVEAAVVARAPNDVITVDFKGWWRLGDGSRCEPLTVRDAYSRYVLAAYVPPDARTETVAAEFDRIFRKYGLPKVIKSDNGVPFCAPRSILGLSKLSARWVALGIQLEHSRPGHPQDNGAHERLHRDIETEVASHVQMDLKSQQAALDLWRREYNEVRPHESLNGRRPAELYYKSPRPVPTHPVSLQYGAGFLPRLVNATGMIRFRGRPIFISTALTGWHVGLRELSASSAEIWFNYLFLGTVDLQTNRLHSAPSRSVKATGLAA